MILRYKGIVKNEGETECIKQIDAVKFFVDFYSIFG